MSDLSFLENTGTVTELVKAQTDRLMELEFAMMQAEEAYEKAKKAYSDFAMKELPELYLANGLSSIKTDDGTEVRIKTHYRASIKKGHDDEVATFLRAHNADHLIKEQLVVSQNSYAALKATGIPFEEKLDINTNSLKAFLKGEIENNNIQVTEIPQQAISWYQWNQAEVVRN